MDAAPETWWDAMLPYIRWISISRFVVVYPLQNFSWARAFNRAGVHYFSVDGVTIFHLCQNVPLVAFPVKLAQRRQRALWKAGRKSAQIYRGEMWVMEHPFLTAEERANLAIIRQSLAPREAIFFHQGSAGRQSQGVAQYVFRRLTDAERANEALQKKPPTLLEIPPDMPREQVPVAALEPPNIQPDVPLLAVALVIAAMVAIITDAVNNYLFVTPALSSAAMAIPETPPSTVHDPDGEYSEPPHPEEVYYDSATDQHVPLSKSPSGIASMPETTLQNSRETPPTLTRVTQCLKRRAESDLPDSARKKSKRRRIIEEKERKPDCTLDTEPAPTTSGSNSDSSSRETNANTTDDGIFADLEYTLETSKAHQTASMFNSNYDFINFDDNEFGQFSQASTGLFLHTNNNINVSSNAFVNTQLSPAEAQDLISQTTTVVNESQSEAREAGDELYCEFTEILDERIHQIPEWDPSYPNQSLNPPNNPSNIQRPLRKTRCRQYFKQ